MNDFSTATIYGIVQGITEFLPVSSSGHLALIPFFSGIKDPGVLFDLAMHVGTAGAVMVAFRCELKELFKQSVGLVRGRDVPFAKNFWLATIVTIVLAFSFRDLASGPGRSPLWIAGNLVVFGALLWLSDYRRQKDRDLKKQWDWKRACLIGVAQAFAVFPGVSRSGATLTAGRFTGMNRIDAASFSFLLSLPIILGGFAFESFELWATGEVPAFEWATLGWGIFVSFVIGILTIKCFMHFLQTFGLGVYFWYRLILAVIVIAISME